MAIPLVIAQMSLLSVLLLDSLYAIREFQTVGSSITPGNAGIAILSAVLIMAGICIAVWAKISMPAGTFSISPLPRKTSTLTLRGPYRHVRHPMYTGAIATATGMALLQPGISPWLILIALVAVLLAKIELEEIELAGKFPQYQPSFSLISKLIPGVY